jgi:hypothetical protein
VGQLGQPWYRCGRGGPGQEGSRGVAFATQLISRLESLIDVAPPHILFDKHMFLCELDRPLASEEGVQCGNHFGPFGPRRGRTTVRTRRFAPHRLRRIVLSRAGCGMPVPCSVPCWHWRAPSPRAATRCVAEAQQWRQEVADRFHNGLVRRVHTQWRGSSTSVEVLAPRMRSPIVPNGADPATNGVDRSQVEIVSEVNAEDTEKAEKEAELIVARIQEGQFNTGQRNLSVILSQVAKSASFVPVLRITHVPPYFCSARRFLGFSRRATTREASAAAPRSRGR